MAYLNENEAVDVQLNVVSQQMFSGLFCLLRMFWKDIFPMLCWLNILKKMYMYFPSHQMNHVNRVYKVKVNNSQSEIYFISCGDAQHATDVFNKNSIKEGERTCGNFLSSPLSSFC